MRFFNRIFILLLSFFIENIYAESPVQTISRIGDKLIRETPFTYQLTIPKINNQFKDMQFIDFGKTYGIGKVGVAYAYTQLSVDNDTVIRVEIEHNDACKIWCNGKQVYKKTGNCDIELAREERGFKMSYSFKLPLKKGYNQLLVKSETYGKEWCVFLQPPSENDAVLQHSIRYPSIGLMNIANLDPAIENLSNWLVIGAFPPGIDREYEPEKEIKFGYMYNGVTWSIPKIDLLGTFINPAPWGTTYQWNYHNGGVAWAMQQLTAITQDEKYNQWANRFCDFQMQGIPFTEYQVNELKAVNSANSQLLDSKLLDFTLAPSLPLIYRLRKESNFKNRDLYQKYIEKMIHYARFEQIRSNDRSNYTRLTPEKYTTWVDDMFMGIPFLMQAGLYADTPELQKTFFDDAASQIIDFNQQVWDKDAQLYMHANFSNHPETKLPHWSRANGWGIWAVSEVLMYLPQSHPKYAEILNHYRTHVNTLVKLQNENGFWRNVLDRPDSPEEISGTAIFTMAIARGIRLGWLNEKEYKPIVMKAWEAIASEIEPDGTVHKICVGTMCSDDVNYYINRPFYDDDTHGSFAVLFAGMEVQRMIDKIQAIN